MTHLFAALLLGATPALADLGLTLSLGPEASVNSVRYSCDGGEPFVVRYVNAGGDSLALVPVEGSPRIFVNVISGSGARYVSGPLVWWDQGDTASFGDDAEGATQKSCTQVTE